MTKEEIIGFITDYYMFLEDLKVYVVPLQSNVLVDIYVEVASPESIYNNYPTLQNQVDEESVLEELTRLVYEDMAKDKVIPGLRELI